MKYIKSSLLRIYLYKVNALVSKVNKSIFYAQQYNVHHNDWDVRESIYRIIFIFVLLIPPYIALPWISIVYMDFFVLVVSSLLGLSILLIGDDWFNERQNGKYISIVNAANKRGVDKQDLNNFIVSTFEKELSRMPRKGEIKRIEEGITRGVSLRDNNYIYRDRILLIKIILYGPIFKVNGSTRISSAFRRVYLFTALSLFSIIAILAYIFKISTARVLIIFVLRNTIKSSRRGEVSKTKKYSNKVTGSGVNKKVSAQRIEGATPELQAKTLATYNVDGRVKEWSKGTREWMINKYHFIRESSKEKNDTACRNRVCEEFIEEFGHLVKESPSQTTLYKWLNNY